jgi:hypothetical protein
MKEPRTARLAWSLPDHLEFQLDFLQASIERYESGHEHEALRMAAAIRILCHDTKCSHSLLAQLGLRDSWLWLDTGRTDGPRQPVILGLLQIETPVGYSGRWVAPLDHSRHVVRSPFAEWWSDKILLDNAGNTYSRSDLVTELANTDGGSHVDPELNEPYAALSQGLSMGGPGWTSRPDRSLVTPVWELMRQIAYEVQSTAYAEIPGKAGPPTLRTTSYQASIVSGASIRTGAVDQAGGSEQ